MKKRKGFSIFGEFASRELPVTVRDGYRIELFSYSGGGRMLVSGAEHIARCSETEVVFLSGERVLSICGEALSCTTYDGGVAEIEGEFFGFSVKDREK